MESTNDQIKHSTATGGKPPVSGSAWLWITKQHSINLVTSRALKKAGLEALTSAYRCSPLKALHYE